MSPDAEPENVTTFRPRGLASSTPPKPAPEPGKFHLPSLPHIGNPLADAKPLSTAEASKLKPIIRNALPEFAKWADEGISATNRRHAECDIWTRDRTGLDEQEYDALADIMIERAQLNAAVAQAVRGLASLYQEVQILIILGPRFWATWRFYRGNGGFVLSL